MSFEIRVVQLARVAVAASGKPQPHTPGAVLLASVGHSSTTPPAPPAPPSPPAPASPPSPPTVVGAPLLPPRPPVPPTGLGSPPMLSFGIEPPRLAPLEPPVAVEPPAGVEP